MHYTDTLYKIGDFSIMCNVTTAALRYWEQIGLISPAFIDTESGYRFYAPSQLEMVGKIKLLQSIGFSIKELKEKINEPITKELLLNKKQDLQNQIDTIAAEQKSIDFYLSRSDKPYSAMVKTLPSLLCLSTRFVMVDISDAFEKSIDFSVVVESAQVKLVSPRNSFAIFHDEEFTLENFDMELFYAIETPPKETPFVVRQLEAEEIAVCVIHTGDYDFLGDAYIFAFDWMARHGYEKIGLIRERYIQMPTDNNPAITEVQIPAKKLNI